MSYETNPILNRIKIVKGWKNPSFPTKTLNYSREIVLWFKIYLFLKVYLWSQKIKLLSCEFRSSEKHTKIFYLSINKYLPSKKKRRKSKWKKKSFLQPLKSPFTKTQSKKARFLLYRDLNKLKKKSELFLNTSRQKKFTKAWLSKVRRTSWINFAQTIFSKRKCYLKKNQHLLAKKKAFPSKKKIVILQNLLWKKIQRNLFHLLFKFQKRVFFLKKNLNWVLDQNLKNPTQIFQNLVKDFKKEYQTHVKFLKSLKAFYQISLQTEIKEKKNSNPKPFPKTFSLEKTYLNKTHSKTTNFLIFLKNKSTFFQIIQKKPHLFRGKEKILVWKKALQDGLEFFFAQLGKKHKVWKKKPSLVIQKTWFTRHLHVTGQDVYFFKKQKKVRKIHLFKFLRFAQKKECVQEKLSENVDPRNFSYRLSFRYNYRHHLTTVTNIKLKYLIENLIQKYFSIFGSVKLFWPLKQFKNLKFYRLFFPAYKQFDFKKKKKKFPWRFNSNLRSKNKRYLSLRQTTNHLKFQIKNRTATKVGFLYQKIGQKKNASKKASKNAFFFLNRSKIQLVSINWPQSEQKKREKKNVYLRLKKKVIVSQSEKRLSYSSKQAFLPNLATTVVHFSKYLDPQPLADHLAKLIGETKRHATILRFTKDILRTLHLKRGLGYRIALSGRINGKNKSRTFYLRKLNRSRPRQTFSKNVNFAMAQARATIGAFNVRIWVYS